jgi:serine/threonine protein kinase
MSARPRRPGASRPYPRPSADTPSPRYPAHVGRYRVERLLGEGGFGRVYLARDEQLQRPVAIKVPHAHLVAQAGDAETYLAEARTVASLDHPNIVPVFDVGNTGSSGAASMLASNSHRRSIGKSTRSSPFGFSASNA